MKYSLTLFLFLFFVVPLPGEDSSEADEVVEAWKKFTTACQERSGQSAANLVTNATHEYYSEIQKLAVSATEEEIQALPLGKQVTTLSMRLRIPSESLDKMSGKDLFVHSISEGWIGKPRSEDETIAEIEISEATATAKESVGGEITQHVVHFLKEDGQWKFDMLPTIALVDETFEATCAESGKSKEEFVESLLKLITGESDVSDAWKPLETATEDAEE